MIVSAFILKIVYEAGYTMMNIGMGSLLGNMAKNDTERATLASARGFATPVVSLTFGILTPQIIAKFGDNVTGFRAAAIFSAIAGGVFIFLHYALTEERNKTDPSALAAKTEEQKAAEKVKITDIVTIVRKNRPFLALVLHSISLCAVQTLGTGAATYMYADVLGDIGLQSLGSGFSSVTMIVILISAPLLARKWNLVTIIRVCLMGGFFVMAGTLGYTLLSDTLTPWLFITLYSLGGGLIMMSQQMQWGLVAESIDYNEYLTGKRNEGTIYGFFSLSRRIGGTISSSLTVLIIAAIGYDATLTAAGMAQADGTIAGIKLMYVGFPMIAAILSWLCFTFIWNLNDETRAKISAWKESKVAK